MPSVVSAANSQSGDNLTTTHVINIPSGVQDGDVLLTITHQRGHPTWTPPNGTWNLLFRQSASNLSAGMLAHYKECDGTETGTATFTTASSARSASITYLIRDVDTSLGTWIEVTSGASLNPPSETASWGVRDQLWITAAGNVPSAGTVAYDVDFTVSPAVSRCLQGGGSTTNNNFPKVAAVGLLEASETQNPDTWTFSGENSGLASATIVLAGTLPPVSVQHYPTSDVFSGLWDSAPTSGQALYLQVNAEDDDVWITDGPATLPVTDGLVTDLDASALTGLSDGDPVATWTDSSGNGNDAAQATAGNQPTYQTGELAGKPVVRFVGSRPDFLAFGDIFSGASAGEMFMVIAINNDPPTSQNSGFTRVGNTGDSDHYPWTDGTIYSIWGSTARKTVGNPAADLTQWQIVDVSSAAGDWAFRIGGTTIHSTATNTVQFVTTPEIGRSAFGYGLDGDVAEILMYDRVLSAPEREQVYDYLDAKWLT